MKVRIMKVRNGYVSNSSSTSFVISKPTALDIVEKIVENYIVFNVNELYAVLDLYPLQKCVTNTPNEYPQLLYVMYNELHMINPMVYKDNEEFMKYYNLILRKRKYKRLHIYGEK